MKESYSNIKKTNCNQNSSLINIENFGAIKGDTKHADLNTEVIKEAIKLVNSNTDYTGLFFPKGIWFINELLQSDGVDFRYVNWQGAGKRHTLIKLANGRNKPLIETSMLFEVYFRDIQFHGNRKHNPDAEFGMVLKSANVYRLSFDNVYFRNHNKTGLLLDGATLINLNEVDAKFNSVGGIKILNCLSVVANEFHVEYNGAYGILCESSLSKGKERYQQPLITLNNTYGEGTPEAIILKGITNVKINGGFNNKNLTFCKITATDDLSSFSHYNTLDGNHVGNIIIDKGNYGNSVSPSNSSVLDLDGRNSNFLVDDERVYKKACDLVVKSKSGHKVNYKDDYIEIVSEFRDTSVFTQLLANKTDSNLSLKVKGDLNSKIRITVYDLKLRTYYNFCTLKMQENHRDSNTDFIINTNGELQYLKIPIDLSTTEKPRILILFSSKSNDKGVVEFYGYNLL